MLTLAPGETISGIAASATAITYTITGMELNAGVEAYKVLAQGQLAAAAGTLYTAPAGTQTFVKSLHLVNATGADVAGIKLYKNGTGAINQLTGSMTIPANGWATYEEDGWRVYNAAGERLMNGVTASGGGGSAGGGNSITESYTFDSSTTDADPGAGKFRLSAAGDGGTHTWTMYISTTGGNGTDMASFFDSWTPNAMNAMLITMRTSDGANPSLRRAVFKVVGRTTATGYRKFTLHQIYRKANNPIWTNGDVLLTQFEPAKVGLDIGHMTWSAANISVQFGIPGFVPLRAKAKTLTASRAYVMPFTIRYPILTAGGRMIVSTAASAGNSRLMVYRTYNRGIDGLDLATKVLDSGLSTVNLSSTGVKNWGWTAEILPPGHYYLVLAIGTFTGSPVVQAINGSYLEGGLIFTPSGSAWSKVTDMFLNADYTGGGSPTTDIPSMTSNTLDASAVSDLFDCPAVLMWENIA